VGTGEENRARLGRNIFWEIWLGAPSLVSVDGGRHANRSDGCVRNGAFQAAFGDLERLGDKVGLRSLGMIHPQLCLQSRHEQGDRQDCDPAQLSL